MSLIDRQKIYAWQQSLEKGERRCRESGDQGDAETIRDVINHLAQRADAPEAIAQTDAKIREGK